MHIYTCENGDKVPSVTSILQILGSHEIIKWANYLGFKHIDYEKELAKTSEFGTIIHNCIENIVNPSSAKILKFKDAFEKGRCEKIMKKFNNHISGLSYKTINTEASYASSILGYGGTIDWYLTLDDKYTLIDFKTSKKIYLKHLFQLGGYYNLLKEYNIPLEQAGIFIINDKSCFEFILPIEKIVKYGEAFNHLYEIYKIYVDVNKISFN